MKFAGSWRNVDCIVTDNAKKNIKSITNIQNTFNSNIVHFRCIAHFFHLISTAIYNDFFTNSHQLCA